MPKRLCNSRGRTQARFGRIRIGWHKQRMLSQMEKMDEQLAMGKMEDEAKEKFLRFKERVKSIIPKEILRRHQSR